MLGATFESLMARAERRATGCFYTPRSLVETTTAATVAHLLSSDGLSPTEAQAFVAGGSVDPALAPILRARVETLRVLDPACGSGAFLVHALELLADLTGRLGDPRPVAERRRQVLTRSIYGVDVNPIAVWLCELRLWLSVVVESAESEPLPNLDRNIRVGDSLAGDPPCAGVTAAVPRRYASATGSRKRALQRILDRAERTLAITRAKRALNGIRLQRLDLLAACRGRDLFGGRIEAKKRLSILRHDAREIRREIAGLERGAALPFSYAIQFAHVGAFDAVIGNPPWVRLHNIPGPTRERLRARFRTFRDAAWEAGTRLARAGRGFAAQIDLSALFVERAVSLCRPDGVIALLVPAKLFRSLAGGGTREMLKRDTTLLALEDWSGGEPAFDAAAYPALMVARREHGRDDAPMRLAVHQRQGGPRRWVAPAGALPLDASAGSPWILIPPAVRAAFDAVTAAGTPLGYSRFGAPTLGVKTGCNAAFVVTPDEIDEPFAIVRGRDEYGGLRRGLIESSLLRPLIRGESLDAWVVPERVACGRECLIWTHGVEQLPEHAAEWLEPWRRRLRARSDAGGAAWWSVFRTDGAIARTPRVVWGDLGRVPRAAVLPAGSPCVALNSCYLARCPDITDALALTALLNSPLAAAWLNAIAEPARGAWHRYLGWTVGLLPIPHEWPRVRQRLACLAERGLSVTTAELWDAAIGAYGLNAAAVAPLAAWILGPAR
jgi:SAM-dependent methyltransferase